MMTRDDGTRERKKERKKLLKASFFLVWAGKEGGSFGAKSSFFL